MSTAQFSFHGRLNDFLQRDQKEKQIHIEFQGRQSIKHLAESLGVPHPEIGRIQVNGRDDTLSAITQDRDRVEIDPIENGCRMEPRFVLDCHLGRLTAHLRMLGFDCLYENDYDDSRIAEIIQGEERILLTRDRRLLMRKAVVHGYCPRSLDSFEQLMEVTRRFELKDRIQPFHRCLKCNHPLEAIDKALILERLEPLTRKYFEEFYTCPECQQIYWKGSHYEKMQKVLLQWTEG
ncbi:MAG TPA: Mut7-C RNAse domain-containing protein [Anaerolineales bacterium]|nr:Mut7-C RNAse domain-containing protein [Anaerolineales bacterium]